MHICFKVYLRRTNINFFSKGGKKAEKIPQSQSEIRKKDILKMSNFAKLKIVCGKPCFFSPL